MEIPIDSTPKLPFSRGLATFTLSGVSDSTDVSIEYSYEPKFGVLGQLMGRFILDGQLAKGFASFLKDLDQTARKGISP